ncbi:MAG: 4-(cytidine 5'-diphospho)-2-C-methyl-D-erythritol kinase [Clostridia bacterium]|nr:4-(cytidine 5'-diphospho)-2-C-methyl-D-erythritol kinase [Clostridia bacterium]
MKKHIGSFFVFLAACLWGATGIFIDNLNSVHITEINIVLGRAFFTSLIFAISILIFNPSAFKIKLKDLWIFVLSGAVTVLFFNFCYYKAIHIIGMSSAAVLMYTAPIYVMIISVIFFKEKLTVTKILCSIGAVIGCALVSGVLSSGGMSSPIGILFGIGAGLGYSFCGIFTSILLKKGYSSLTVNFYNFLFGAIATLIVLLRDIKNVFSLYTDGVKPVLIIVLMALLNTVIPYIFYSNGLKTTRPSDAVIIASIEPVVATFISIALYNIIPDIYAVIGIAVILCAVLVLNITNENQRTVKLKANAKINLTLQIVGTREDGYHLLDSVFQSVSLYDEITLQKQRNKAISVSFDGAEIPSDENLCKIAAKKFFEKTKVKSGVKITVKSHIPLGSGMGGGSSDAAAVLVGLNNLFETKLTENELIDIGKTIGADVPFCIVGGTARVNGIGENVTPLKPIKPMPILIIKDKQKGSTAEMYKKLDEVKSDTNHTEDMVNALNNDDSLLALSYISNEFNKVCDSNSEKEILLKNKAKFVGLSGSGPSVYGVFESKEERKEAYEKLKENHNCFIAEFANSGIVIE